MASYEVEIGTAACACGRARVRALFEGQLLDLTIFLLMKDDAAFPRGHVANTQVEGLFALLGPGAPFVGDTLCRGKKVQELLPACA